jgi:anti-sigma factor RsiW
MRCGDLERYLEAFLDGRLGRSRSAVLRRHLALCAACQARVERLRQFERDTQRRFRSPELPGSVWEGLELDLVGSHDAVSGRRVTAPPRPLPPLTRRDAVPERPGPRRGSQTRPAPALPAGRGAAARLAVGALMVALALGTAYRLARTDEEPVASPTAADAYLAFRLERAAPMLSSNDARQVADWLAVELGRSVPALMVPDGFSLAGATRADLGGEAAGAVIFSRPDEVEAGPVMLFVTPESGTSGDLSSAPSTWDVTGLHEVHWAANGLSYAAVGPFPEEQLQRFQP